MDSILQQKLGFKSSSLPYETKGDKAFIKKATKVEEGGENSSNSEKASRENVDKLENSLVEFKESSKDKQFKEWVERTLKSKERKPDIQLIARKIARGEYVSPADRKYIAEHDLASYQKAQMANYRRKATEASFRGKTNSQIKKTIQNEKLAAFAFSDMDSKILMSEGVRELEERYKFARGIRGVRIIKKSKNIMGNVAKK